MGSCPLKDRKTERQKGRKVERQKNRKTERRKDEKTERRKDKFAGENLQEGRGGGGELPIICNFFSAVFLTK